MIRNWLIAALLLAMPASTSASTVTVNWTGNWFWYNADSLLACRTTGEGCEFWNDLQARGVALEGWASTDPFRVSMTFDDTLSDAAGFYITTATTLIELGPLSFKTRGLAYLGPGVGRLVLPPSGVATGFNPATSPRIGGSQGTGAIGISGMQFVPAPHTSLVQTLRHSPLTALSGQYCMVFNLGDCDGVGTLTATSVVVPEAGTLGLLLTGLPMAFWFRRAQRRRVRTAA